MKKLLVAMLIAVMSIGVADAGLRFGVKLGTNVDHMSANITNVEGIGSIFSKNNRAGFTGGVLAEYMTPLLGLGFDLGVQYAYLNSGISDNKNFIQIPLNLKYKFSLPVVGRFLAPYLFTGPSFDFKLDKSIVGDFKAKTFQTVWNVGLGLELAKHLQIGASYGFGMNKIAKWVVSDANTVNYHNNYWTISAAWLF